MSEPMPFMKGRFNLYETPEGGLHIMYLEDGQEDAKHVEVPAVAYRAIKGLGEGKMNMFQAIKAMMNA